MLMRLSNMENLDDLAAQAYRRLLTETIVEKERHWCSRNMSYAIRASIGRL